MLVPVVVLAAVVAAFQAGPAPAQSMQCRGQSATIVGTPGNDRIKGTPGSDVIVTMGGNDRIKGLGGNDIICSGPGRDRIVGGGGNDYIAAGSGNDRVSAGAGRDVVNGGRGNDRLLGGGGNDSIEGGPGDDVMAGGGGNDRMNGGTGFDQCGPASIPGREPGGVFGPARAARACEVEEISLRQQTVRFAGQDWTILGAVGSYEDPSTFGNPSREPRMTDQRHLYVKLRITNNLSEDMRFDDDMLLLEIPGHPTVAADRFGQLVDAGTTEEPLAAFRVPDRANLRQAAVVLGNSSVEQIRLPLESPVATERFPIPAILDTTPRPTTGQRTTREPIVVQLLEGSWDLELGDLDVASNGSRIYEEDYRSGTGFRFLRVSARFTEGGTDGLGENVLSDRIRVEIDGVPRGVWTRHSLLLDNGEAVDVDMGFHVPADASVVTILIGRVGFTVAEFPVVVPDLSR